MQVSHRRVYDELNREEAQNFYGKVSEVKNTEPEAYPEQDVLFESEFFRKGVEGPKIRQGTIEKDTPPYHIGQDLGIGRKALKKNIDDTGNQKD